MVEVCRFGIDQRQCKFGHPFDLHVAALEQPLVILLEQHGADEAGDAGLVGEDADDIGAPLHFLLYPGPVRSMRVHFTLSVIIRHYLQLAEESALTPLGGSLLYELGATGRLRMGYGQELEGASLFTASSMPP